VAQQKTLEQTVKKQKILAQIGLCVEGALLVLCGILCIAEPGASILSLTNIIGWVLIIAGVQSLIFAISVMGTFLYAGGSIGTAILDILCGIVFLRFDGTTSRVFVILFAVLLFVMASYCIGGAFLIRPFTTTGWPTITLLLLAALFVILGAYSLRDPAAGAAILMLPIGIALTAAGIANIAAAIAIQDAAHEIKLFKKDIQDAFDEANKEEPYFKDVDDSEEPKE